MRVRGGICAVAATRDIFEERRWGRFISFLECVAWALICLLVLDALGLMSISTWQTPSSLIVAIAGGALFGLGALLNGACAFRVGGWMLIALVSALALFGLWRLHGAWRASRIGGVHHHLTSSQWPPAFAMAVLAIANVSLLLLAFRWPYTTLLVDLALHRMADDVGRSVLVATFLTGAIAGAVSARSFKIRFGSVQDLASRIGGGALMGFGASMIPGGNDGLVLIGLPLLQPTAIIAYASMVAAIAAGFAVRKSRA